MLSISWSCLSRFENSNRRCSEINVLNLPAHRWFILRPRLSFVNAPASTSSWACLLAFFLLEDITGLALYADFSLLLLLDPARVHSDSGLLGFAITPVSLHIPECSGAIFAQIAQWRNMHIVSLNMPESKLDRHLPWAVQEQINRLTRRIFLTRLGWMGYR